nr:putative reverse transcriptase domain-containing protein [Tanacetum cinerariifolium]
MDKVARSMAEIGESRLIGPELVQETTDKVVLIKEKLKAVRDHQKSYADNRPDTNLHVHSEEIKIDKTLRFIEEPVEIIDREVKNLKRSRIPIVKVHWNLKRGHEDFIKSKYPHLIVEQAIVEMLLNGSDEYAYSVLEWIGWVRLLSFGIDRMGTPTQYWNGPDGYAYLVFGAKKEWGLSPKAKVRVLHTAQLDVTVSSNH